MTLVQKFAKNSNNPTACAIIEVLKTQNYQAQIKPEIVQKLCQEFNLSKIDLALNCLEIASCYGLTPISNFNVGAVAIGESGTFYFGANQEYADVAMAQTVHAEQSAISHALHSNENAITDIVVNYTPCGHCRQFMNELNCAENLQIHLPHSQHNHLQDYLPDAFGPKDLEVTELVFDIENQNLTLENNDPVVQAGLNALNHSHAPYSQAFSGVALLLENGEIITGRYIENAAFNPSFPPLQSALNYLRLSGLNEVKVERVVLVEKKAGLSHRQVTESLARTYLGLNVEYFLI